MPLDRVGISNYYFVWRRLVQHRPQFLSQFKSDPSAMHDLRRALAEYHPGVTLTLLTDDQVLAAITRLVAAGELLIAREDPAHGGAATQAQVSGQESPAAAAPPPSSSKSTPPESQTLPSDTNAAAQAAALIAAAAAGAGVCPH